MLTCVLGRHVASTLFISTPNLSEGADSVGGQLCGEYKECFLTGVTISGRVWRKVPESEAWSVLSVQILCVPTVQPPCET